MAVALSQPGVYIQEQNETPPPITSPAPRVAFVGRAVRGPINEPTIIVNHGEYVNLFGGLWQESPMSVAVSQFFENGGTEAVIVRIHNGATSAQFALPLDGNEGMLVLESINPGAWGNWLRVAVDYESHPVPWGEVSTPDQLFNLTICDWDITVTPTKLRSSEVYRNLSVNPHSAYNIEKVLGEESELVRIKGGLPSHRPAVTPPMAAPAASPIMALVAPSPVTAPPSAPTQEPIRLPAPTTEGSDGNPVSTLQYLPENGDSLQEGIYALHKAAYFSLLCIPPYAPDTDVEQTVWEAAAVLCKEARAILLVDTPRQWDTAEHAIQALTTDANRFLPSVAQENTVVYFPRLRAMDEAQVEQSYAPCGAVAGLIVAMEIARGIWTAPAGITAAVVGIEGPMVHVSDDEMGRFSEFGVNCLRTFPVYDTVIWGARLWQGGTLSSREWKYLPVRRLALYIEFSLSASLKWIIFEPNDEPLWRKIRLIIQQFMHTLFMQGAFAGNTPNDAFFVKCGLDTTTPDDIQAGQLHIQVGFAPLRDSEFITLNLQLPASPPEV